MSFHYINKAISVLHTIKANICLKLCGLSDKNEFIILPSEEENNSTSQYMK